MKFVQVQEIEFTLRIFSQNLWLEKKSLSKQKMTFNNTVNFLGEEWTAELRKENELFLFAKKDETLTELDFIVKKEITLEKMSFFLAS